MTDISSSTNNRLLKKLRYNPFTYIISQSWKYAEGQRKRYLLFILMAFLANMIMLLSPYVMGEVFNALQSGGDNIVSNVAFWLCAFVLIEFISWPLYGPSRVIERNVAFKIRGYFFDCAYKKLRHLPLKWHQDHHSGNTINRIRKAGDALYDFTQNYYEYITTFVSLAGPILILLFLSWPVAVVALIINVALLAALYKFDRAIMQWLDKENEKEHKFSATFFDYVANFTTIISLRLGGRTQKEMSKRYNEITPSFQPHVRLNEWKYFILNMTAAIMVAVVLLVYIWSEVSNHGAIMIGTTVAIYRYLDILRRSFFGFAGNYQRILKNYTDLKASIHIMESEVSMPLDKENYDKPLQDLSSFQITNLTFAHNQDEVPTLENLNLTVHSTQKIALVGESGAGKSTLMALIRGLYVPETVNLTLDNVEHTNLTPLHDKTTLIPQEPEIFENTIHYNITVGVDYDEDAIQRAIKIARFDRVMKRLPKGLETDVREKGVSLSGGEKQRLALARGILAASNSSIILMDEPTSSVDAQNEIKIYDNIFRHFKDRVVISSIHRLHLLGKFDQIFVMDQGRIVQAGTMEELKGKAGLFQTLWNKYQESSQEENK